MERGGRRECRGGGEKSREERGGRDGGRGKGG